MIFLQKCIYVQKGLPGTSREGYPPNFTLGPFKYFFGIFLQKLKTYKTANYLVL